MWIYYSVHIIYIGAEFTESWANELGARIYPSEFAVTTQTIEIQKENAPIENNKKVEIDESKGEDITDIVEI